MSETLWNRRRRLICFAHMLPHQRVSWVCKVCKWRHTNWMPNAKPSKIAHLLGKFSCVLRSSKLLAIKERYLHIFLLVRNLYGKQKHFGLHKLFNTCCCTRTLSYLLTPFQFKSINCVMEQHMLDCTPTKSGSPAAPSPHFLSLPIHKCFPNKKKNMLNTYVNAVVVTVINYPFMLLNINRLRFSGLLIMPFYSS